MAKSNLPRQAFGQDDFKVADRFGRMYMRMVQPNDFELNDRDEKYFKKLKWVYPLLADGRPRQHVKKMIVEIDGGIWANQAEALIKDAEKLFASFSKVNKTLLRGIYREKMLGLASLIEEEFCIQQSKLEYNEDLDIEETITFFKGGHDGLLAGVEQVRKIWNDIAKYEHLDKADEDADDAPDYGDIDYDDTNFEITDHEESPSKDSIHVQTLPRTSSEME